MCQDPEMGEAKFFPIVTASECSEKYIIRETARTLKERQWASSVLIQWYEKFCLLWKNNSVAVSLHSQNENSSPSGPSSKAFSSKLASSPATAFSSTIISYSRNAISISSWSAFS